MSLRTIALALVTSLGLGCGGGPAAPDEPSPARDQPRDDASRPASASGGKWSGWRYQGDRNDCFFVVGRRCFKTEAAACAAARCGAKKCEVTGGGPAQVACAK
jgi:hypothetical protein